MPNLAASQQLVQYSNQASLKAELEKNEPLQSQGFK
jgi:hypothetical protein